MESTGVLPKTAVGEPGGVGQQIADQDRAGRWAKFAIVVHLDVGERGDDAGERIVQGEAALLDEDHRGDARDRLGHRVDAEDVVGFEGVLIPDAPAVGVPVHDLAAPGDQRHDARRAFVVDELPHGRADAREDLAGEAGLLGSGGGEVPVGLRVRSQREGPDARLAAAGDQPGRDRHVLRAVHLVGCREAVPALPPPDQSSSPVRASSAARRLPVPQKTRSPPVAIVPPWPAAASILHLSLFSAGSQPEARCPAPRGVGGRDAPRHA